MSHTPNQSIISLPFSQMSLLYLWCQAPDLSLIYMSVCQSQLDPTSFHVLWCYDDFLCFFFFLQNLSFFPLYSLYVLNYPPSMHSNLLLFDPIHNICKIPFFSSLLSFFGLFSFLSYSENTLSHFSPLLFSALFTSSDF